VEQLKAHLPNFDVVKFWLPE